MLEVFANDRQCVTQVLYPRGEDTDRIRLCARGGPASVVLLDAWQMAPLRITDARHPAVTGQ
jgi:beta-fructofuranosidase